MLNESHEPNLAIRRRTGHSRALSSDPMENASLAAAALLAWVALIYLMMAAGSRKGELVWGGRQIRRIDPSRRFASLGYGVLLVLSAIVLLGVGNISAGPVEFSELVPARFAKSATFAVGALLAVAALLGLAKGSRWERMLFTPIVALGSFVALWATFA